METRRASGRLCGRVKEVGVIGQHVRTTSTDGIHEWPAGEDRVAGEGDPGGKNLNLGSSIEMEIGAALRAQRRAVLGPAKDARDEQLGGSDVLVVGKKDTWSATAPRLDETEPEARTSYLKIRWRREMVPDRCRRCQWSRGKRRVNHQKCNHQWSAGQGINRYGMHTNHSGPGSSNKFSILLSQIVKIYCWVQWSKSSDEGRVHGDCGPGREDGPRTGGPQLFHAGGVDVIIGMDVLKEFRFVLDQGVASVVAATASGEAMETKKTKGAGVD